MNRIVFFALIVVLGVGCSTHRRDAQEEKEQISYYDRNGDGKVDLEKHQHPGVSDSTWEFRDDDYDGRYEKSILYGFAVTETAVDIPVPTGVKIETKPVMEKTLPFSER